MKNKIATRVVTLATAGAMTASSVVSPSVVMASEVDTGVSSENENSDCNGRQGTGSEYSEGTDSTEGSGSQEGTNPGEGSNENPGTGSEGSGSGSESESTGGGGSDGSIENPSNPDGSGSESGGTGGSESGGTGGSESGGTGSGGGSTENHDPKPVLPTLEDLGTNYEIKGNFVDVEGTTFTKSAKLKCSVACLNEKFALSNVSFFDGNDLIKSVDTAGDTFEVELGTIKTGIRVVYTFADGNTLGEELQVDPFVVDMDAPEMTVSSEGATLKGNALDGTYYMTSAEGYVSVSASDVASGVDVDKWVVSGLPSGASTVDENGNVVISAGSLEEGRYTVSVSAVDNVGNTSGVITFKINTYTVPAGFVLDSVDYGTHVLKDGVLYIKDKVDLAFNITKEDYVDSFVLVNGETGEETPIKNGKVSIGAGRYSFKMVDELGNITTKSLSEVVGENIENTVVDTEGPVVGEGDYSGDCISNDATHGFVLTGQGTMRFGCTDNTNVSLESITVDGKSYEDYEFHVNTLDVKNLTELGKGTHTIKFTVTDALGNSATKSMDVYTYLAMESISASTSDSLVLNKDQGIVYAGGKVSVGLEYDKDTVKNINVVCGEKSVDASSGTVELTEDGKYMVEVEDFLGNTNSFNLMQLLGYGDSSFAIDSNAPVLSSVVHNGTIREYDGKKYYTVDTTDSTLSMHITDNESGIDTSKITVVNLEGVAVSYTYDAVTGDLVVPISQFTEGDRGVVVGVVDKFGNELSAQRFEFSVYTSKPTITGNKCSSTVVKGDTSYSKDPVNASISGYSSYKITSVALYKDDEFVENIDNGSFTITEDGFYTVKTTDIVGDVTTYGLDELFEGTQSKISFDLKKPEILNKTFDGNSTMYEGTEYYTTNGDINIMFADNGVGMDMSTLEVTGIDSRFIKVSDDMISINTEGLVEGSTELSVSVADALGNKVLYSFSVFMLRNFPVIVGNGHGTVYNNSGKSYIKGSTEFLLDGTNDRMIRKIELLKDGKVISEIKNNFKISNSGKYSVRLTALSGETKTYALEDLYGDVKSDIELDMSTPEYSGVTFSGESKTVDGVEYYTSDGDIRVSFADGGCGIDSNSWTVEGVDESYVTKDGDGVIINSKGLLEGSGNFTVMVMDNLGHTSSKVVSVFMHRRFPEIMGKTHTGVLLQDGTSFFNKDLEMELDHWDTYKIKRIKLLRDGEVLQNITDGKFTITGSGNYTVRVVDITDVSKEYKLEDLFTAMSSVCVRDDDAPVYSGLTFSGDEVTVDGVTYYTKDGDIAITYGDEKSGIDSDSWSVSGAEFMVSPDGNGVVVETSSIAEGKQSFKVSVKDKLGNVTEKTFDVFMFREAPEIGGDNHSGSTLVKGNVYSKAPVEVNLDGYDNYKIKRIELWKNGELVSEVSDGSFVIDSTGSYQVRVVDLVENARVYELSDLFEDMVSSVIVDTSEPVCSATINDKDIDMNNWVTSRGDLHVAFSDDIALGSGTITVNGKEFSKDFELATEGSIDVDLITDVPRAEDGKYHISVSVTDIAGNASKVLTKTVSADYDAPEFKDLEVFGRVVEDSETGLVYFDEPLEVTGSATDIGSGVSSIEFIKDGEVIGNDFPMTVDASGKYSLRVTDVAGLSSSVDVRDILKSSSNTLVRDNDLPVISRVDGFSPKLVYGGKEWYTGYPELTYSVTDSCMKSIEISINGDTVVDEVNPNGVYKISTDGYTGDVSVGVKAIDRFGHVTVDTYSYSVDMDAPTDLSASITKASIAKGGKEFFKENPSVSVGASDTGVGVLEYRLSGSKSETSADGKFDLSTGEYYVEVVDRLGNSSGVKSLGELLGINNTFVVDGEKPTISVDRQSGQYGNWYNSDVNYNIELRDNVGIDRAEVVINGTKVKDLHVDSTTDLMEVLWVSTSDVPVSSNGMYDVRVNVTDNAGNTDSWSDVVYVDRDAPVVNRFVFNGCSSVEGAESNGSDRYGFFFEGAGTCDIYVTDGDVSGGINKVHVTLTRSDGTKVEQEAKVSAGSARIEIPSGFKGFISAYAVDNVGNVGDSNKPDGIVSETVNWHNNSVTVDIALPATDSYDTAGNPLYGKDASATATVGCSVSGIRKVSWGIDGATVGTITVDGNGKLSGDTATIKSMDKNLVLSLDKVLAMNGNENGKKIWVSVLDRTGHESRAEKNYSIDKDAPEISVAYDRTEADTYYNANRTAMITVKERNFDPSKFKVEGTSGSLGSWSGSGDVWTNTMTFSEDKDYSFSLSCTDRAGNVSNTYSSEKFTIDKTAPKMSVSWNVDKPSNGNYYNSHRVATVNVVEHNFDGSRFKLEGNGTLSGWSGSGDTHTATVAFNEDGEYEFSISGKDLADNESESYSSGKFNIDATTPELSVEGIDNGVSYKKDVNFSIKMSDNNIDISKTSVTLTGRKNGNIRVNGVVNEKTGEFTFSDLPKEEVFDDVYTMVARVVDKAGNTAEKTIKFSVNRYGSAYKFLDSKILGTYINAPEDAVITETNVDKLDMSKAKVSVIRDGNEIPVDEKYIHIEESGGDTDKYTYTYTVDKAVFDTDGKYVMQVYSHAEEGTDYNSVSEEYAFVLDTTAPEIIISGVESGGVYKDYERTVTIDVRDMSGVDSIEASLNGKAVPLNKKNGVYSFDVKESKDLQNIAVDVIDLAGNISKVSVDDFTVSSDAIVVMSKQPWFKFGVGGLIAFTGAMVALIGRGIWMRKREEHESAVQYSEMYKTSGSGSGSGGSTDPETATTVMLDNENPSEKDTTKVEK